MIQQNGGHPVSSAEIQRQQVQQHLAPAPAPIVKIAPPVSVSGNQAGAKPGQPQQSDAKQNQRAEAAHSEKDSSGKPTGPVKSTELAKPANQPNGPVRDMRAPAVNQPERANQPQITNVTNKSEVKANSTTQGQPAVPQKNDARKDQPAQVQAPMSKNQAPTSESKPTDVKSQNAPPTTNDKVKANPQTQGQPEVLQKNDARRDHPIPTQAPVSKSQPPIAETKPSEAKSQSAAPATNNNPANRPPTATSPEDQRKQAEPKGQEQKGQQKGQQAQQQQKPDKSQKATDKPAQQPDKNQKTSDKPTQQPE